MTTKAAQAVPPPTTSQKVRTLQTAVQEEINSMRPHVDHACLETRRASTNVRQVGRTARKISSKPIFAAMSPELEEQLRRELEAEKKPG